MAFQCELEGREKVPQRNVEDRLRSKYGGQVEEQSFRDEDSDSDITSQSGRCFKEDEATKLSWSKRTLNSS